MTDEPKKPTMQDKLVAQIQSFNQQKEQARDTFNSNINQCDGGIKACLWMLQQLDAEAKELAEANLTAEREEALRKEQDLAAAEKSKADHAAGLTRPAPDVDPVVMEDCAQGPYTSCGDDLQRPETGLIGGPQVHAGELEPPRGVARPVPGHRKSHIPTDEELGPRETH